MPAGSGRQIAAYAFSISVISLQVIYKHHNNAGLRTIKETVIFDEGKLALGGDVDPTRVIITLFA